MAEHPLDDQEMVPAVPFSRLVAWNFTKDGVDTYHCKNCHVGNIKKSGANGNLIRHCARSSCYGFQFRNVNDPNHTRELQPIFRAYHQAIRSERERGVRNLNLTFAPTISTRARQVFAWLELVVLCDLPISVVENRTFRKHARPEGMSRKTFRKFVIKFADIVGMVIGDSIGPGCCVADGWTTSGIHYWAMYHSWPTLAPNGDVVNKLALLSLSPLSDEKEYGAGNHADSIKATYEEYGLTFEDLVICMTLDNTNTNPATARLLHVPMIGAYCHRLNLASSAWIKEAFNGKLMQELDVIHAVMIRASTLKVRGALKEHTSYVPELKNKTRWTGYHTMAIKYDKIHEPLDKTGKFRNLKDEDAEDIEVDDDSDLDRKKTKKTKKIKPTLMKDTQLQAFRKDKLPPLKCLRNWFKVIQSEIDLAEARTAFDKARKHSLLKGHSIEFEERLQPNHKLVVAPHFEAGVEKIINEETELLTEDEKEAIEVLLKKNWKHLYPKQKKEEDEEDESIEDDPSSPTKFLKKINSAKKATAGPLQSRYIKDLKWIIPTTVIVERLFSRCRKTYAYNRKRLLPRAFEAIIFLKENREWWDLPLVQEMVSGRWDSRLSKQYNSDDDGDTSEENDF